MNNLIKKFTSKTGFFLFLTLISLIGIYFMLSKEGMQDDYYTNSQGVKIPDVIYKKCVNNPNGERICDEDTKQKPDELKIDTKDRGFIPPQTKTESNSSTEPVPANSSSLEEHVYVDPSAIPKKYRTDPTQAV